MSSSNPVSISRSSTLSITKSYAYEDLVTDLHMHELAQKTNISDESFLRILLFVAVNSSAKNQFVRRLKELAEEIEIMLEYLEGLLNKLRALIRRLSLIESLAQEELKANIEKLESLADSCWFALAK